MINQLHKRIFDIAYKYKLSHLGSYISSVDLIDKIFETKLYDDIFILSCGHASLALYCVLEKHYTQIDAEELFKKHGGHPHLCEEDKIYCSTGSLGLGLLVAIGRGLANANRNVYVLISDGESAEGSIWEGLRFIQEHNLHNVKVYININGYSAYDKINKKYLIDRLKIFLPNINIIETTVNQYPFLNGLNAHYHVMSDQDYEVINSL